MTGVRQRTDGVELDLQVVPRASRESLGPVHGDRLKLHVSAPPVDGAANEAVRALLARLLGVPRGQVTISAGLTGRKKTVTVAGDPTALVAALAALVGEASSVEPAGSEDPAVKKRGKKR